MGVLPNVLNVFGLTLLAHAVYSAYEHAAYLATLAIEAETQQHHHRAGLLSYVIPQIDLPLDITLETLIAVLLLCVGVVLASPELKPIEWRVWAGKLERSKEGKMKALHGDGAAGPIGNPYLGLEQRNGFLDVRKSRAEFAAWVREGAKSDEQP